MAPERAWSWVLRIAGLAGIVWETVVSQHDRPLLIGAFLVMMGFSDAIDKWVGR